MSFFQDCICHALMGSRLAATPPFGGSNLGRMSGREGINNLFTIPDQRVSQNIPWNLKLIL